MASRLQHWERAPPLLLKLLGSSCVESARRSPSSHYPLSARPRPILQSLCVRVRNDGHRHRIFHRLQASHEGILQICSLLHISCSLTSSDPFAGIMAAGLKPWTHAFLVSSFGGFWPQYKSTHVPVEETWISNSASKGHGCIHNINIRAKGSEGWKRHDRSKGQKRRAKQNCPFGALTRHVWHVS